MLDLKISLQLAMMTAGLWAGLTEKAKEKIGLSAVWVLCAVDDTTDCVLAIKASLDAPSPTSILEIVRMMLSDKSALAAVAGTENPWTMSGVPKVLMMDHQAAHHQAESTRTAIAELGVDIVYLPFFQPHNECLFKVCQDCVVNFFASEAFTAPATSGAGVFEDAIIFRELNRALVKHVVDIYHNTPVHSLFGACPRNAWSMLTSMSDAHV
jgi:putative transposase